MKNKKILVVIMLGILTTFVFQMCKKDTSKSKQTSEKTTFDPSVTELPNIGSGGPVLTVTVCFGHSSADCGGMGEYCLDATVGRGAFVPCHIPCIGSGNNCCVTFGWGMVVQNNDSSIFEGVNPTNNFVYNEIDSLFIKPGADAPKPLKNTWKILTLDTASTGYSKFINVPAQHSDIRYNADGDAFYVVKNITYTATPLYSEIY